MLSSPAQASRRPSEFRGSHVQPATLFQVPTPEVGFCRILREAARRGRLLGPLVRRRSQGRSRRGEAAASLPAAAPPGFDGPVSAPALQVAAPAARAASCQQEALLQRAQPGSRPSQAFPPQSRSHIPSPDPPPPRPGENPRLHAVPTPVCVCGGVPLRHSRKTPPKPQTALTSILVSGGSQASRAASQLSLGSREHKVAGRFWLLGSVPLLVPSGGHVKADKPKFWRGGGGGRSEGVIPVRSLPTPF